MNLPGISEVIISLILVFLAIGISCYWHIPVVKDMALGSVRSFLQLIAVGYALELIFDFESVWLVLLALIIMIIVGAQAASSRVKSLKGSFRITLVSMVAGSLLTIGIMFVFKIISFEARFIIPLGGMIISNSMNASALTIERLSSDIRNNRLAIETSLSLGKSWRQTSQKFIRAAATAGMVAILNFMKTVGIVALPGAMTGMILAGSNPIDAVLIQIIVAYMLLCAVAVTSIVTVELTVRKFFNKHHQLLQNI